MNSELKQEAISDTPMLRTMSHIHQTGLTVNFEEVNPGEEAEKKKRRQR